MAMTEEHKSNTGKDVVVYVCILAIAGLQFVIACIIGKSQHAVCRLDRSSHAKRPGY